MTLLLVVVYAGAMAWVMQQLPSRASGWLPFLPGAILVAVGSQLVHLLVVLYLAPRLGRSSELYGALGAATVILLWLYLEARLVVGGSSLNAALWERRQLPPSRAGLGGDDDQDQLVAADDRDLLAHLRALLAARRPRLAAHADEAFRQTGLDDRPRWALRGSRRRR